MYLVGLDPTRGREIKKTRLCVVVRVVTEDESARLSPNELNGHLQTVIVAPLTSSGKPYPFRLSCVFQRKQGLVVLHQTRAVDRERLVRRLGAVSHGELESTLALLREMFEA